MGKKSKRNNRIKSNSPRSVTTLAEQDGRMPRREGIRFYDLLSFLAEIAVPRLEAKRKEPLGWKSTDLENGVVAFAGTANTRKVEGIVLAFILEDIDWLVEQVDSGRYDEMFLRLYGCHLTAEDKKEIQSWKLHILDDFFVVTHRPREGAVFVQVGRLQERDQLLESRAEPSWFQADYHEPRVFVVQGLLAEPLQQSLQTVLNRFEHDNPSLKSKYPELSICQIRTALLPYNGGITYITRYSTPENRYNSPKDLAAATKVAVQACKAAFANDSAVVLYRYLNPETDAHVRRLKSDPLNQNDTTFAAFIEPDQKKETDD
jgi:hypothetical protein